MTDERAFHDNVRRLLDEDLATLDETTRRRLAAARRHAASRAGRRRPTPVWALAAGVAAAALALALLLPRGPGGNEMPLEDLDILVSGDDIEFYEELEFYEWLSTQTGDDHLGALDPRLPGVDRAGRRGA